VVIVGTMILFEGSTGYIFARAKSPSNTESKPIDRTIVSYCCVVVTPMTSSFFNLSLIFYLQSVFF
jgi:hypothetical protein